MKFKTLFLSASLLATASIFSYCTKETPAAVAAPVVTSTNDDAGSRATHCKVNIAASGSDLDICGTQNSLTVCGSTGGVTLTGTGFVADNNNWSYPINAPAYLLISQNPGGSLTPVTATVTTATGTTVYNVPAAGTVRVTIDDVCNPL